jgi:vacuolar-type H+-ATPase subunit I/STV1
MIICVWIGVIHITIGRILGIMNHARQDHGSHRIWAMLANLGWIMGYVGNFDFNLYFSRENNKKSIVVVGDPLDSSTQALMQKIIDANRDSKNDVRLLSEQIISPASHLLVL